MTRSGDQEIDVLGEYLRSFPAIDTHDHLYPVEMLQQLCDLFAYLRTSQSLVER